MTGHPTSSPTLAPAVLDPEEPLSPAFRAAVSTELAAFLAGQAAFVDTLGGDELAPVHAIAEQLLGGGKRLRPAFCVWGYVAAAGLPGAELSPLLTAAASLDLLHVSALVHDDVMDSSDLRRGRPAAHRQFEAAHRAADWLGDPAAYGRAAAILLGDLLLMWSAEMLQRSGMDSAALDRALPIVAAMRTEVTSGQFLDIVAQARPLPADPAGLRDATRVVEYKSARYTVQRPLQLGAALGGGTAGDRDLGGERLHDALAAYGSPLGRAFQFRDDLLGVFGDPQLTGKPAGDDLREGKRTVLVEHAYAAAGSAGRALLRRRLGDPGLDAAGVAELQEVIVTSGARDAVEAMITEGHERALAALDAAGVTDEGRRALTALADAAVRRRS